MGFIFGGNTPWTYDQLQQKRKVAESLLAGMGDTPRNVGEGLNAIGKALAYRGLEKRAGKEEARLKSESDATWAAAFGGGGAGGGAGGGSGYAPSATPWTPTERAPLPKADPGMIGGGQGGIGFAGAAPADPGMVGASGGMTLPPQGGGTAEEIFMAELTAAGLPEHVVHGIMMNGKDESGFDPNAVGDNGAALGILQWNGPRKAALEQFAASVGGSPTDPKVQAQFTVYELQGPEKAAYDAVMSTKSAGEAGAAFVNQYERPAEEHRARREAAYLGGAAPAGGSGGGGAPQMDMATLMALAGNPMIMGSPEKKAVVDALIGQQLQGMDPMYQMEMEKAQLELAQLRDPQADPMAAIELEQAQLNLDQDRNGGGGDVPSGFATLDMQAQAAGYAPGTPEYMEFMRNGGGSGTPAAFTALDMQAQAAGFVPGTPEYMEFMATRGAGGIAEAKARGETVGAAAGALPGASSMAALIDQQIQDLKSDPYLPNMLWPMDSKLPNVSADAARVQGRIDQLQGGAFLQARQMLKGGGAITDFEGQKAEAAFVRMNAAQSVEDFTAALDEFNSAVQDGIKKLEAQAGSGGATPAASGAPVAITSDAEYDALRPGTMFVGPDGKTRRKP